MNSASQAEALKMLSDGSERMRELCSKVPPDPAEAKCHVQRIIQTAYDIAKAAKRLVVTYEWSSTDVKCLAEVRWLVVVVWTRVYVEFMICRDYEILHKHLGFLFFLRRWVYEFGTFLNSKCFRTTVYILEHFSNVRRLSKECDKFSFLVIFFVFEARSPQLDQHQQQCNYVRSKVFYRRLPACLLEFVSLLRVIDAAFNKLLIIV